MAHYCVWCWLLLGFVVAATELFTYLLATANDQTEAREIPMRPDAAATAFMLMMAGKERAREALESVPALLSFELAWRAAFNLAATGQWPLCPLSTFRMVSSLATHLSLRRSHGRLKVEVRLPVAVSGF